MKPYTVKIKILSKDRSGRHECFSRMVRLIDDDIRVFSSSYELNTDDEEEHSLTLSFPDIKYTIFVQFFTSEYGDLKKNNSVLSLQFFIISGGEEYPFELLWGFPERVDVECKLLRHEYGKGVTK